MTTNNTNQTRQLQEEQQKLKSLQIELETKNELNKQTQTKFDEYERKLQTLTQKLTEAYTGQQEIYDIAKKYTDSDVLINKDASTLTNILRDIFNQILQIRKAFF